MRRAVKYAGVALALAGAAAFSLMVGPSTWIAWAKNREAHCMHEGHVIVDQIKAQDPSINATWTLDDDGQPDVVIRNVFDREKQDMILTWAKAVKQQGRVHHRISLDFQQETPHSSLSDTILRTEHF